MRQWTYVYWDSGRYIVMRQVPDKSVRGRVQSTVIAEGTHQMASPSYSEKSYYTEYASMQRQIGDAYATEEWPLRTCMDFDVKGE